MFFSTNYRSLLQLLVLSLNPDGNPSAMTQMVMKVSICVTFLDIMAYRIVGMSDTAILVSRSILKPLFTILNSSRYL